MRWGPFIACALLSCEGPPPAPALGQAQQAMMMMDPAGGIVISPDSLAAGDHFGASLTLFTLHDGGSGIVVGAPDAVSGLGAIYVLVHNGTGFTTPLYMDGPGVSTTTPHFGFAVASADFNQDGYADLAVGVPGYSFDGGAPNEGQVRIYPGVPGPIPFSGTAKLVPNPRLVALRSDNRFGASLAIAPDVNGDGKPDLIIGVPGASETYIYDGVPNSPLLAAVGASYPSGGGVVASADVNHDGASDLITSDPEYSQPFSHTGLVTLELSGASTSTYVGEPQHDSERFGSALAALGDINGDGFEDVAIGARGFDAGLGPEGRVSVYGGSHTGLVLLATLPPTNVPGAELGASLANVGDFWHTGSTELLVGAPQFADLTALGSPAGAALLFDLGPLAMGGNPRLLTSFAGTPQPLSLFGETVAGGGDLNGDGLPDLVIGAPGLLSVNLAEAGGIFVYFGALDAGLGTATDAGRVQLDGGSADAGARDSGTPDAGLATLKDAGTPDAGSKRPDAGLNPPPDSGFSTPDAGPKTDLPLSFTTEPCGCDAGGAGVLALLLLIPLHRRARAGRGSSRTPAPRAAAPRRS